MTFHSLQRFLESGSVREEETDVHTGKVVQKKEIREYKRENKKSKQKSTLFVTLLNTLFITLFRVRTKEYNE